MSHVIDNVHVYVRERDEEDGMYYPVDGYYAESFEAQSNRKIKSRRIKTMIESSPDLRIDSSFHPDNPAVGHITQKCSSSDCDEMIRTHDSMIGKRCLKCYYENWEDLYAMGVVETPPPTDMENKNRYTRKTPAEHQEQERKSKELMGHLRKRDEEKLERLRQYGEDRVKEKGKWDKANPTEREEMIRDNWKRINGSGIKTWRAESKKTKYGMIAAGVITAFALLPEIKKRF